MGTLNPQNPNFASSTEPSFSHQVRSGRLSAGRCRHTGKNARNRENWSQEDLERCADVWATEFVQAHLRPHLASWLRELDSLFPDELPFGTSRVGSGGAVSPPWPSPRTTTPRPHTDRDPSSSVRSRRAFPPGHERRTGGGRRPKKNKTGRQEANKILFRVYGNVGRENGANSLSVT